MKTRMILAAVTASLIVLGAYTTPAVAETTDTSPTTQPAREGHRGQFEAALAQLNLSPAQRQKIDTILADTKEKLKAVKDDGTSTNAKEQRRTIIMDARRAIVAVLTPEQRAHLRAILKADRAKSST